MSSFMLTAFHISYTLIISYISSLYAILPSTNSKVSLIPDPPTFPRSSFLPQHRLTFSRLRSFKVIFRKARFMKIKEMEFVTLTVHHILRKFITRKPGISGRDHRNDFYYLDVGSTVWSHAIYFWNTLYISFLSNDSCHLWLEPSLVTCIGGMSKDNIA